jgi:hypothetical protein
VGRAARAGGRVKSARITTTATPHPLRFSCFGRRGPAREGPDARFAPRRQRLALKEGLCRGEAMRTGRLHPSASRTLPKSRVQFRRPISNIHRS